MNQHQPNLKKAKPFFLKKIKKKRNKKKKLPQNLFQKTKTRKKELQSNKKVQLRSQSLSA
jgi:hypothetical protein